MAHNRESNTELISRMDTKRRCRGGGEGVAHPESRKHWDRTGWGGVGQHRKQLDWTGYGGGLKSESVQRIEGN